MSACHEKSQNKQQHFVFWHYCSYHCCLGPSKFLFIFCLELPFSKISYHIETSHMICTSNQLTGFYVIWVFNEMYFRIDYECLRKTKSPNKNLFQTNLSQTKLVIANYLGSRLLHCSFIRLRYRYFHTIRLDFDFGNKYPGCIHHHTMNNENSTANYDVVC